MTRAIVIGGGLGGLATAVRLLAAGLRVTLVEGQPTVGGRAAQICERGYTFDVGPSLITMPELLDDLFRQAGSSADQELRLRGLDPFYRIAWQGDRRSFLFNGDRDSMVRQIAAFSRDDADAYDEFIAASRRVYEEAILVAGRHAFQRLTDFARLVPRIARLGALRSVDGFVGRYFREPHVRQVFGFHSLFIGGDPYRVPAVYAALAYLQIVGGVWYAEGGVRSIVDALERLVHGNGGDIVTGIGAAGILTCRDRVAGVRLEDGSELAADVVVSNADVSATRRMAGLRGPLSRQSMSCFLLYLGTTSAFPSLHHHTLLVSRDYRRYIRDVTAARRMPRSVSLYLHAPARTEPAMARPGGEAISVLVPVPNLRSSAPWPEAGDDLRERVLEALEAPDGLGLEGLRASIQFEDRWTPLDFRDRLRAQHGNAFGPEPLLRQSAYFRQHNRYRSPRGLYQVGAGTHPGAGIPGVLLSAEVTCGLVLADLHGRT